jgi:uncharacterized protein
VTARPLPEEGGGVRSVRERREPRLSGCEVEHGGFAPAAVIPPQQWQASCPWTSCLGARENRPDGAQVLPPRRVVAGKIPALQHAPMQADSDNERLVLEFFSCLNTENFTRLREIFHEEVTWTPMIRGIPGAGVHRGKAGIIDQFLIPVRGMFRPGDPKTTVDTICSKGSLVLTETRGAGQVADGRPYENLYAWAFEIRDGKILAVREYMDSLYVSTLFGMKQDS